MMYKDKDKQREANKLRMRQVRSQGNTKGNTDRVTQQGNTDKEWLSQELKKDKYKPKRGLDIKCFADLPADVQQTIDKMSVVDGKIDKDEKAKRTEAAIKYQEANKALRAGDYETYNSEVAKIQGRGAGL